MEPMAWDVLTHWDSKELITFLSIVGVLCAVSVGIPAIGVGVGRGWRNKLMGVLLGAHGTLLVFVPLLLLVPMFQVYQRVTILVGLVYVSMLLVHLLLGFPKKLGDALLLVAGPWVFGALSGALGALVDGTFSLFGVVDVLLQAGLVAFAAFWAGFPAFFFTRSSGKEQWRRFKANPPLYLFGLAFVFGLTFAGLWVSYYAWIATLPTYYLPGTLAGLITLAAVAIQVGVQVRQQVLFYREL